MQMTEKHIDAVERAADEALHAAKAERDTAYYYKDSPEGGAMYLSRAEEVEARAARLAEVAEHLRSQGWRTMESAPKDGTQILLSCAQFMAVGSWLPENYFGDGRPGYFHPLDAPTHWMPLPKCPIL